MNNDYKNICYLRVYALKAGEGNDNYQDYIYIAKLYTRTYEKLQNTKLMLKHESTKTLINSDQ